MSQDIWSNINPETTSGLMLAALLDDFKDALMTGFAGTSRPAQLQAGGYWINTTNQAAPNYYWAYTFYDGTNDTEIFRVSILNGFGGTLTADASFTIQKISADTVAPILHMIKNRIINNGQVLTGDTVGEIRFTGRTDTSTNPTVAYFKFNATDDETTSAYGGTFTMYSTPDASATITEHLKFIDGLIESTTPHKINSLQLVGQNVSTTASITQLSASKVLVEFTGSTATDLKGINSGHDSKTVILHNRSTATVTLKHQNTGAAAADRLKLPNSVDHAIAADCTAVLYYCTADTRWKIKEAVNKKPTMTIEKLNGAYQTWTVPTGISKIRVTGYRPSGSAICGERVQDQYGNIYAWGEATHGQLGDGSNSGFKSSPVAVLGGLTFMPWSSGRHLSEYNINAIAKDGSVYAWGLNLNPDANLGVGDLNSRSSPVAVLGGLKFSATIQGSDLNFGLTPSGKLYAWGGSDTGAVGDGNAVASRSSPVAVLGGLRFSRISELVEDSSVGNSEYSVLGITRDGDAYAWGFNTKGQLGVGDRTSRSSPVAVLGGLKFKKILSGFAGLGNTTIGLTTSGILYGWGANSFGQLGVGDTVARSSPVAVLGGLVFSDVFCGDDSTTSIFAITSDGTAYAWGNNNSYHLGVGDNVNRSSPVAVLGGLKFKRIYEFEDLELGGGEQTFGITTDDDLYSWGANVKGSLGIGLSTTGNRSSPIAVLGGLKWDSVINSHNQNAFHGISKDGVVYSWGTNTEGQLGLGDVTARSSPVAIVGFTSAIPNVPVFRKEIEVTPGGTHTVILSQALSNFGIVPLGYNIDNITIEYES